MARRDDSTAPEAGPSSRPIPKRKGHVRSETPNNADAAANSDDTNMPHKPAKKKKIIPSSRQKERAESVQVIEDSDMDNVDNLQRQRRRKSPVLGDPLEMKKLKLKLETALSRNSQLEAHVEELLSTVNENPLIEQREHYESRIQILEEQIRHLTDQLAIAEPRSRGANYDSLPLLQYISRTAAAYERKPLEEEILQLRSTISSQDTLIKDKVEELTQLKEAFEIEAKEHDLMKADLELELKAEIERNKALTEKAKQSSHINGHHTVSSATRVKPGVLPALSVNTTKHSAVVSFYEDLTNVLVPDIKFEPGRYFDKDDKVFQCIYTYMDPTSDDGEEIGRSLNFTLRNHLALPSEDDIPSSGRSALVTSLDQLKDYMEYTPLHLDKEASEFTENLGFFKDSFRFERNQLSVFYGSLGQQLKAMTEGSGQDDTTMGT